MFVMKYCHQQQMSKCVAGSCCYFCLNEQKSGEGAGVGEREMPHSSVLKRFMPCLMLNPDVLSICQTKHSAAFFRILILQKDWMIKSYLLTLSHFLVMDSLHGCSFVILSARCLDFCFFTSFILSSEICNTERG